MQLQLYGKKIWVYRGAIDEFVRLLAELEWQKMREWKELSYDKFS